jgi:hypothetical protein
MSMIVPPAIPSAAPLAVQFGELAALLDTVIGAVQAGDAVDLAGLDRRAEELCQAARQLAPRDVPPVAEAMQQVIARLDRLQSVLPDPRAGEHADAQRAAAAAYGRSTPTKR